MLGSKLAFLRPVVCIRALVRKMSFLSTGHYKIRIAFGAPFTQGMIPSIPISRSISPEGFLLLVQLLVVIIVMVERMNSTKTGHNLFKYQFPVLAKGVPVGPVFLLGLLALVIDAACTFRAEKMPSLISCWMAAKVMAGVSDVDVLLGGILSTQDNA
ncbi:hypothetical protein Tco_0942113, partial [Tanacetum coccineum]